MINLLFQAAIGKTIADPFTWTLSGGSLIFSALAPTDGLGFWQITGNTGTGGAVIGDVQKDGYEDGDAISLSSQHEFVTPDDSWTSIYVRLTDEGTTAPEASSHTIDGSTWHLLTRASNNIWWRHRGTGPTPTDGDIKVEFCTRGDGTDIVASGNYTSAINSEF